MNIKIDIKEILKLLGMESSLSGDITGIAYDSRQIKPGYLFVALKGQKSDGHQYLNAAKKSGAIAALVETIMPSELPQIKVESTIKILADVSALFYDYPSQKMIVVGVTGSNGKTTTCYFIESIAKVHGFIPGLLGTITYRWPGHDKTSTLTTPMSRDIQKYFAKMVDGKCNFAVMEVSSHALEMDRVRKVNFAVGVYSNLSQEHLDFHKNMENYFESKKKLFTEYLADYKPAVINNDDEYGKRLIKNLTTHDIWSYGIENSSRVNGEIIELTAKGGYLRIKSHECKLDIRTPLIGKHNCYNILAAATAGLALGIPEDEIEKGIMLVDRIPGRFEAVDSESPFRIIVDFAHTPDAMEKSLSTLQSLPHNRIITVFGCGGDRDKTKRPLMGKVAADMSDQVVITSDNPRSESPESIISEILPGFKDSDTPYIVEADRKEAIRKAIEMAMPEDIILISGKGHETYQIIGNEVIPFDDKNVAMEFL